ncbi:hypothetical protein CDO52_19730 [Nocardiopsis gilva YIM 90087]|uniref:Uncharacterized protein n=1 Tax=Nocardiopsis gilva YIM 90087 TaxID=1235441 RepID=A0A223S9D0_9ACTN|nr:hypothetical protein [Nocardiopsis gilva]ASU84734.1 hypothetical protein CDO52_19730 [Nocardiopsis gilva YIM 90087]
MLDDPRLLAAVSSIDLVIAGIALGAAQRHLGPVTDNVIFSSSGKLLSASLVGAPVGALVAAIVWTAIYAAPNDRHRWRGTAAALTAGTLLGLAFPHPAGSAWTDVLMEHPVLGLVPVTVLWGVCLVFLKWAALCARTWLDAAGRERTMCVAGIVCAAVAFGCMFGMWTLFRRVLEAEASSGWFSLWAALVPIAASPALPPAVGCVTAFLFVGLVRRSNVRGPADRPLLPIFAACAVVLGHVGLLVASIVVFAVNGIGQVGGVTIADVFSVLMLLTVGLAGAISVALGAWSGGRGRLGVALCTAAVFVLTAAALQPGLHELTLQGARCLFVDNSLSCWGRTGMGMVTTYSDEPFIKLGLPVALAVGCGGATFGSGLRGLAARWRRSPPVGRTSRTPRRTRHTVSAVTAVVATALVVGSILGATLGPRSGRSAEELAELRSQVEPATVSRAAACEKATVSRNVAFDSGSVTLASSSDEVLAAFGRTMLDGAALTDERLFNAAHRYCRVRERGQ